MRPSVAKTDTVRGWLFGLITAVVLVIIPLPAWMIERFYSRQVYATWQEWLTAFSNLVPFALLDVMLLAAVVLTVRRFVLLFRTARSTGIVMAVWEAARRLIRAAAWLTVLFLLFWGFNYRRMPLEASLVGGAAHVPTVDELAQTVSDTNSLASRIRARTGSSSGLDYGTIAKVLDQPFQNALKRFDRPRLIVTGRPKFSLVLTPFFTWSGVNGMINPLALESIVHSDLLPYERPFVLAHEWGHLAGFADEAEASAIGWYACMQGDPPLAYSATLYLLIEAGAALPVDRWREAAKHLDPAVQEDLNGIRKRMERENATIRTASTRVYDSYLKANRVDDGIASYSRALQLILSSPLKDALSTYVVK